MQHGHRGAAMPGAVHQIEKGMMGWDPNRPTENPSLLLLLAYSFSRTFRDQRPTHNKKDRNRKTEIEKRCTKERRKQEGCYESEEPMQPSSDYQNARPPSEYKEQSKGFPEECLWNIHSESGQPPTSGARWSIFRPQLHPNMLDSVVRKWCATLIL